MRLVRKESRSARKLKGHELCVNSSTTLARINTKIDSVDKRIDEVELCIARSYISKQDFATTLERVEAHMIRIEDKLDELVLTQTRPR